MKTNDEYIKNHYHCPVCNSDQIEGAEINIEGIFAEQEITCVDCNSAWLDVYTLTKFDLKHHGDDIEDQARSTMIVENIDPVELESHRLLIGQLTCKLTGLTQDEADALEGVVNLLDCWSDEHHDRGVKS